MTDALLQVFLLVGVGLLVARLGWIDEVSTQSFSNLVLKVFLPALLFRTMATVDFNALSLLPIFNYLSLTMLTYALAFFWAQRSPRIVSDPSQRGPAVSLALASTFANSIIIGIPVVKLFYGPEGLVILLTVVTMHSLVLLTTSVLGYELLAKNRSRRSRLMTLRQLAQSALLHPVVVPIFLGVFVSFLQIELPVLLDSTLLSMGQVAIPCCLVLLGATVYHSRGQIEPRAVGPAVLFKLVIHPLVVYLGSRFIFQAEPLTIAVLTSLAAMPSGANPYLLAQRYNQGVSISATAVVATTAVAAFSLPYVLSLFPGPFS
jgi:predicted permease